MNTILTFCGSFSIFHGPIVHKIMFRCDVGYDSVFPKIGADWFNYAASQGRQVLVNNRCGANQSDMVTPEYATFSSPLVGVHSTHRRLL